MSKQTKIHPDYLKLVRQFPLRPIRSMRQHDQAMAIVTALAVRDESKLSAGERDYLAALTVLLEDFDRRGSEPPTDLSALDLLRHLMEANDLNVSELGHIIGSQPTASSILAGRRQMSKTVIRKLADHFGVNPGLFLRDGKQAA